MRFAICNDPATETLTSLNDFSHCAFKLLEVIRGERLLRIEVVIKTIGDWWPNTKFGFWKYFLHRLRQHVCSRVAKHRQALGLRYRNTNDSVAVREFCPQILQYAIYFAHHDFLAVGKQMGRTLVCLDLTGYPIDRYRQLWRHEARLPIRPARRT